MFVPLGVTNKDVMSMHDPIHRWYMYGFTTITGWKSQLKPCPLNDGYADGNRACWTCMITHVCRLIAEP